MHILKHDEWIHTRLHFIHSIDSCPLLLLLLYVFSPLIVLVVDVGLDGDDVRVDGDDVGVDGDDVGVDGDEDSSDGRN